MSENGRTLQVIEKAFNIINYLQEADGARVSEIASDLEMPPSTVHVHLNTLKNSGVVVQEGDIYYLSLRFLRHGNYVQQRTDAYKKAEKYVGELIKETGYRSVFMIEEHGKGVYLHTQHGESPSWEHEVEGDREHLHVLAAGKVILAHLSEEKVESIIDRHGLLEQTKWTISDPTELRENLADIREQGYAFNRGENIDGVHAIGAPALGPDGRVVGGFSISGPSHRLDEQSLRSEPLDALLGIVNEYELELSLS